MAVSHEEFKAVMAKTSPKTTKGIDAALAVGIPWSQIISWLIEFGPKFASMIKALIAKWSAEKAAALEAKRLAK